MSTPLHQVPEGVDLASVDTILTTTRAVRRRLDLTRPVPDEVLRECLEIACQAPTGGNSQRWRWIVVTDADKRARLGEIYRAADDGMLAGAKAAAQERGDAAAAKVYGIADWFKDVIQDVPVHVIPCVETDIPMREAAPVMEASWWGGSVQASWSFMLAARARGLGSLWTTMHIKRADEVAELLGLPETYRQIALIPVAYTVGTEFKPATRPPLDAVVHWNGVSA